MNADLDVDAGKACLAEWNIGSRAVFGRLDVSREVSVKRWIDAALKRFGRIDGLVNNAGIADPNQGTLAELSLATWNRYLGTNLTGLSVQQACPAHAGAGPGRQRQCCLDARASIGAGYGSLRRQQGRLDGADARHGDQVASTLPTRIFRVACAKTPASTRLNRRRSTAAVPKAIPAIQRSHDRQENTNMPQPHVCGMFADEGRRAARRARTARRHDLPIGVE